MQGEVREGRDESDGSVEEYDNDQLESPHSSGDDRVVHLTRRDVTKRVPFDPTNMNNSTLVVGNTFHDAAEY